jgi:uncharacterized ferredoxin-like protein
MLIKETDYKDKILDSIAEEMCIAARTAPKAKGIDLIVTAIAQGDTIGKLADRMLKIQKEQDGSQSYIRDSESIRQISHIVLIGTKLAPINLKACGVCGYKDCASKDPKALCAFNPGDLGIAIGSAISVAMDHRIDNRIMFSVGRAAVELGLLGPDVKIAMGIPLSATGKNPFFDRK